MPAVSLPSYDIPEPVEVKDVTGDGLSDIVVLHGGWNSMGVYVQTADGSLSPEQLFPIPYASSYNVQGLALGDINNDGLPDAAIADYNYGLVVLYHEPGAETPNNPPLADAGTDQSLELSQNPLDVFLDGGNSSDPDNDPLTYHWTLSAPNGSNAVLNDLALMNPGFTADIAGIYTVQLQVFDGKTYSQTDTVTISVLPANLPPTANAGADQTVLQGTQVSLDGSQSKDGEPEPNGTITSWSWTQIGGPAVTLQNATSATASFTAPRLKGQKNLLLTFELTVADDDGATANDRVQITVVK